MVLGLGRAGRPLPITILQVCRAGAGEGWMRKWLAAIGVAGGLLAASGTLGDPPGFEPPSHGFLPRAPKIFGRFEEVEAASGKVTLARDRDAQRTAYPARLGSVRRRRPRAPRHRPAGGDGCPLHA